MGSVMACLIVRKFWHDSLPVCPFWRNMQVIVHINPVKVMVFGKIDYNFMFDGQ